MGWIYDPIGQRLGFAEKMRALNLMGSPPKSLFPNQTLS
jgi:hypothetical protein